MKVFVKATFDVTSDKLLTDQNESRVQSLTELIDFNSVHNASHPFCVQAKADGSLNAVTHAEFKDAVSRCADWVRGALDAASTPGEPVALLMESDFSLVVYEFALISSEVAPLVLSPRLPLVAIEALLKAVGAKALITSPRFSIGLKAVLDGLAAKGTKVVVSKPYHEFSDPSPAGLASTSLGKPKALDETILLLHSSGTTGLPKPIPLTHRMLLSAAACYEFDTEEQAQGLNLTTLPMFHGFGLVAPALSMAAGKTTLFPASDGIPNARSLVDLIRRAGPRSMMTVPMLLDDICNLPGGEGIRALAPLDFVGTGGAALGAGVGDQLVAGGVRLLNFYGVTETGPLSLTFVPSDDYDWHFFRLRQDIKYRVTELEPRADGERRFRLAVFPPGRKEAFEIADQLVRSERHPDTDFAAVGRDDDIIVLATGEKADPLILESMLNDAPAVKAAVAFGNNRFHLGVIVEPQQELAPGDEAAAEALRESVWAVVQAAGAKMDSSAHVPSADAIVVIPAGTRMPRTDKGSIARKEAYVLFAREIDQVYERLLQAVTQATEPLDLDRLEESLVAFLRRHVRTRTSVTDWNAETSLFDMGVDSLQMQQLRRILVAAVSKTPALTSVEPAKLIPPQFFYVHPTIREMAAAIAQKSVAEDASITDAITDVNECVANFRLTSPSDTPLANPHPSDSPRPAVVLLTGSSGSLGAHCVAEFARRADVARVICLVRKERGTNAQPMPGGDPFERGILKARGLELGEPEWAKVATIEVDPAAPRLGLNPMVYAGLQGMVTHIVHAAWPMNYLLPLRCFRPQFAFLRNLLQLAAHGRGPTVPRFVFVSSIAAVARVGLGRGGVPIPEAPVPVKTSACGVGYADGKLVCEKILENAARDFPDLLEVTTIRCGQITGARQSGVWNDKEQIPMLLKSGQNLGSLPRLIGTLSWIPVDDVACVVADVALCSGKLPAVLHLENPMRQPWKDVISCMSSDLGLPEPSLSFETWLEEVAGQESSEKFPVQQLYLFFKKGFEAIACGEVVLDTQVATKFSSRLRELEALDKALLGAYIAHWKKIRYFST
ncbi:hypothetical protein PspLS_00308 [Pyricularia sp. CBS 133598]|nr:hypothetical protein PspLS_00308 [Pyricularia sp. CBS 133598]